MEFYLSGGGDYEYFHQLDQLFMNCLSAKDTLLLLPYACDPSEFQDILDRVEETYNSNRQLQIKLFQSPTAITSEMMAQSKAILIDGGNTFDLVTTVRASNLETQLKGLSNDKIFYADSAGAILLGKDVSTAFFGTDADEDSLKLQDYRGLDLLDSWNVHAHYITDDEDTVQNFVWESGSPILALYEETGIHVDSEFNLAVLSDKPLEIYTAAGKTTIRKGERVSLKDFF